MTTIPNTQGTVSRPRLQGCSASGNVTRGLLGYLALAGPFYAVVSLALALTRRWRPASTGGPGLVSPGGPGCPRGKSRAARIFA
jgi:hypothetical protein